MMILGTVRRGKWRRTRRVMVVGGAVGEKGAQRVNWLLRLRQLKAEAEGEWKAKGRPWSLGYRGRGGETRIKVDSDKI